MSRVIFLPSPILILTFPAEPATGAKLGAAAGTAAASTTSAAAGASSVALALDFAPSTKALVSGVSASEVLISFAPKTSPIVKVSSPISNRPESTKSGNIAGSSRFEGSITVPASNLQHNTAGSFSCALAVSTVIDIEILLIYFYRKLNLI